MTIYTKFTPTEIEAIAKDLRQQLSSGTLTLGLLETFKFRGPEGKSWTVSPQAGAWYCFKSGGWQPAQRPDAPLDGPVNLFEMITLPLSPAGTGKREAVEPDQPDPDIRQMIENATRRIRESYNQGKINSAEAENLLKDLYLLDPSGLIWSCGVHTGDWYFFRQGDWEVAVDDGPNPPDFQPGSPYTEAAKQVISRFTESDAAAISEQVVPDWTPAPGFPGINTDVAGMPIQHNTAKVPGTSSARRTRMIILVIFIFLFIMCACLFALGIGGIFFID